ncbi:MFS transporter [Parasphingorhabdus litoris]
MLAALTTGFVLSHAFRTTIAIASDPLIAELSVSAHGIGAVAGAFNIAFAVAQPVVGVALDRYGPRNTVAVAFVLAILGSAVSASANGAITLIAGEWMIGFGCAPSLLAAMVFISRRYPPNRFALLSGIVFSAGGAGMLITGTPLAWIVETWSWRAGFVALGILATLSWIAVFWLVEKEPAPSGTEHQPISDAIRDLRSIVRQPYTAGICCLAATSYAAFLALRGLWLGPLFSERHAFSLIEVGHVAFVVSIAAMLGPLVFGWLDPGNRSRRTVIIGCSAVYAAFFVLHAFGASAFLDVALVILSCFLSGYITLQYADLRSAYPADMTGRALSVFTMAMFAGVSGMQWVSGLAASIAPDLHFDPVSAALLLICGVLALGTLAFWLLPWPPNLRHSLKKTPNPELGMEI